jgi:hypothetical protein
MRIMCSMMDALRTLSVSTLVFGAAGLTAAIAGTPVRFTTQPHKVENISVYVDGVRQCYTGSDGDCTIILDLTAGLHKTDYVWATCNDPSLCASYGMATHYVFVPDQTAVHVVRIPTVRVRWYTEANVTVSLNGLLRAGPATQETGTAQFMATANVMSGCYTTSYFKLPGTVPPWPATIPGSADPALKGFDPLCLGSNDTYPLPAPDNANDTDPPEVRVYVVTSNNTPPTLNASSSSVSVPEGTPATNSGTWSDPDGDTVTITASIGTVTQGAGTWSWSNPSPDNTSYSVTITADDGKGGVTAITFGVTVTNVNPTVVSPSLTPSVNEGGTATLSFTIHDPGLSDTETVVVQWGDGTSDTISNSPRTVVISHTYLDDNPTNTPQDLTTVTITVTDKDSGVGGASLTTLVKNVDPVITGITVPAAPLTLGATANVSASFTDPGTQDTHTCTWTWGDGTTSVGTVNSRTCTGSKTYSTEGVYRVSVTVTDDDTGSVQGTAEQYIKVDGTPPVISGMPAAGCTLWPPNHKMVSVATVTAADALSGIVPGSFKITGTSNEPYDPKNPDIVITPNGTGGFVVQLRADRLGDGAGRIYTLTATASDLAGNTARVTATCTVPHDQGH